jgi:hypothetical protein
MYEWNYVIASCGRTDHQNGPMRNKIKMVTIISNYMFKPIKYS